MQEGKRLKEVSQLGSGLSQQQLVSPGVLSSFAEAWGPRYAVELSEEDPSSMLTQSRAIQIWVPGECFLENSH